ncbi:MAG TPA: hypothetical protein DDW50_07510 [Firmicutes bacterium]|jgi:hypothetical protein|nr:hypothetical protein [Bacillota bacterium]
MADIYYINNQLFIDGETIDFSHIIKSIKSYEELVLVLITVPKGEINNRNVYAVNIKNKAIIWRIQEPDLIYDDSPYINFDDLSDSILVGNWNGIFYEISKYDGSIIRGIQTR